MADRWKDIELTALVESIVNCLEIILLKESRKFRLLFGHLYLVWRNINYYSMPNNFFKISNRVKVNFFPLNFCEK